jgi:hypothetical protein
MDVALLTCADLPALPPDDQHLLAPLRERGLTPHVVVWDDPKVDWERFRLAVVRGVWDYFVKPAEWSRWLERVTPRLPLLNPPALLRWNGHKAYLLELAERGLPVTPTERVLPGAPRSLARLAQARGWDEVVVKPAISGGGRLTRRFTREQLDSVGQGHLEAVLAEGEALVQPFLARLHAEGERSYVFIDGHFSHAVDRAATMESASLPDGVPMAPREDELALARQVLAAAPTRTLYGRVDVATGPEGGPLLQELEVIEPRLFFGAAPGSAARLADAIAREARAAVPAGYGLGCFETKPSSSPLRVLPS